MFTIHNDWWGKGGGEAEQLQVKNCGSVLVAGIVWFHQLG